MENENLRFIQRVLAANREKRRVAAVRKKHAKQRAAAIDREAVLFIDDARMAGFNTSDPAQLVAVFRGLLMKLGFYHRDADEFTSPLDWDTEEERDDFMQGRF